MAFTVTARHSAGPTTSSTQTQTTNSRTPTADSLLLVFWGSQREDHTTAENFQTPTGGGWTYTQRQITAAIPWQDNSSFASRAACYSAPVDGSPSAHTITVDSWSDSTIGAYTTVCCDVTGHDTGSPITQTVANGDTENEGDNHAGTITLGSAPAVGNLVVVLFQAGADDGGGFAAPTFGGQSMTQLFNQDGAWLQSGLWYRVVDGTESSNTITCSDVGDAVGAWLAIAVEIEAESATATDLDGTDTTQAQTATAAALTQTHELGADGAAQAQSATAAALTQIHELAADSVTQAQSATAATLTQVHELQPTSAVQGQASTVATLVQAHELAATDAVQAQTADTATVAESVTLNPASTVQAQTAATAALTQVHELTPVDTLQAQTADAVVLVGDVLINLDFVALAPVFAHGSPTAPEFRQRVAASPELGHGDAGEPEFTTRAAGDSVFARGSPTTPETKPRTALAPAFAHGDPGEPTT